MKLLLGDCLDKLKELDDNSVDSIVTDPPYGLSFMGKKWDYDVPSQGIFEECLRVLKPGGHLLSFAGSRTYHRMAVRVEDAGFEIRDQIMWIYGSGFPKSLNIGKGVDKKLGNEREVVGTKIHSQKGVKVAEERTTIGAGAFGEPREADITKGNSEYEGWGTALKPAHEPIVMARKPLSEKTVVDNVLEWGTGGINVEESRIPYKSKDDMEIRKNTHRETNKLGDGNFGGGKYSQPVESGRFPSNIIFDEEAGKILDEQSGGASRFFYCPKTSKKDRNEGVDGNNHPTVKPTDLMLYLICLVTPKGGTTLDPFMGSGSTGKAAVRGGFDFVGIEREKEYKRIAEARIQYEIDNPYSEEKEERIKINKNSNKFF
jgi:site-specific DNA-methyltransferase (adenine-specific)